MTLHLVKILEVLKFRVKKNFLTEFCIHFECGFAGHGNFCRKGYGVRNFWRTITMISWEEALLNLNDDDTYRVYEENNNEDCDNEDDAY